MKNNSLCQIRKTLSESTLWGSGADRNVTGIWPGYVDVMKQWRRLQLHWFFCSTEVEWCLFDAQGRRLEATHGTVSDDEGSDEVRRVEESVEVVGVNAEVWLVWCLMKLKLINMRFHLWPLLSEGQFGLTINFTDNTITVSHGVGLWSRAALSRRRGNGGGDGGELWNCLCRLWPYNLEVLLHFPRISGILCVKCEHGNVICRLLLVWLGVKCGFITSRKGFGHSYVSSFMCGNYISGSLTDKSRDIWLHKTHAFT